MFLFSKNIFFYMTLKFLKFYVYFFKYWGQLACSTVYTSTVFDSLYGYWTSIYQMLVNTTDKLEGFIVIKIEVQQFCWSKAFN